MTNTQNEDLIIEECENYDKPYKSFNEQIQHLEECYGLSMDGLSKEESLVLLKSISYYDLVNGTKDLFMENDRYKDEVNFSDLVLLSIFDKSFQNILFKYSLYAERKFKNILANVIASHKSFGVDHYSYLDASKYIPYRGKSITKTIEEITECIYCGNNNYPTTHYVGKKNHIPPWILFKNVSFSTLIDLVYFLPDGMKTEVAKLLFPNTISTNDKVELLIPTLTIIRRFRNVIAHNYKFVTYKSGNYYLTHRIANQEFRGSMITPLESRKNIKKNDAYSMLLSLLLIVNESPIQMQMKIDFSTLFAQYSLKPKDMKIMKLYLTQINFPLNLIERFEKYCTKNVT
ncbi:Abi family protein [Erysipelothrix rhusiopathiae]|nr:Abi family protein [Erysipelothrix rhusiopathiae]MDE9420611.1 Abi family protein [Erysipelothrix rhusiopathiae]